jgi:hypothetical protein
MNLFPEPEIEINSKRLSIDEIKSLLPSLLAAAQSVYDAWHQVDGMDEELGGGGICHFMADRFGDCLSQAGVEDFASIQAAVGENHVYIVALLEDGVYSIDIPPGVYETGGGYSWTKRSGVAFQHADIVIYRVEGTMSSADFQERYCEF